MLPALMVQELAMLGILIAIQDSNHRPSTLLNRLRA